MNKATSVGQEHLAGGDDNSLFIGSELSGKDSSSASGIDPIGPEAIDTVAITTAAENQG